MFSKDLKQILCRTCLINLFTKQTKLELYHIFATEELAKKLMLCSSLTVEDNDEYPQHVCVDCYNKILQFYEFQEMCSKSLEKFRELLETASNVKQENPIEVLEENYALTEDKNNNCGRDNKQVIDVVVCTEQVEQNDTYTSPLKKRGRPPKQKVEEKLNRKHFKTKGSCGDVKNTKVENVELEKEVVESAPISFISENECEVMLEIEVISDMAHSTKNVSNINEGHESLEAELVNDSQIKQNVNINKQNMDLIKEAVPKEDMTISEDSESDSSTYERKYPRKIALKCDRCEKSFNVQHRFEAHKRQHDGLSPYSCTFEGCERTFNRWHYYNEHLKDHKGELHKCDVDECERVYKNKSALNIHKRKYHQLGPELKTHMCEVCGKVFKSSAVLNEHRYTHIDRTQLPYVCEEPDCPKRFSTKEKLKIHKMRHAGIKNFICPYCGMRKTTRNELKIHINYHTLERTWPCRFCTKVCNSAGNLKTHVKNMHERAKDFACRFCERTFAKADTKKYHEMTHTGEKPHECKECGRRFVQPAALRTHKKIHLREKTKMNKNENQEGCEEGSKEQNILQSSNEKQSIEETEAMVADILSDNNTNAKNI